MNYKRNMYQRSGMSRKITPVQNSMVRGGCSEHDDNSCVSYCESREYPSLAMVYSVNQCWREIDDSSVGFERGTIFTELDKPFMGDKCKNGGCRK